MERRIWKRLLCALVVVVSLTISMCDADGLSSVGTSSGSNLAAMSIVELEELETKLKTDVKSVDGELEDLKHETTTLKADQKAIEEEANKLLGAHEWEKSEKMKKEQELQEAKRDVEKKQENMSHMSTKVTELRNQIKALEDKLQKLSADKAATEKRFHDPSLTDVLNSRSQNWGDVSRNMYEKTKTNLLPAINEFSETAKQYQERVRSRSRVIELIVSFIMYGFVIAFSVGTYNVYKKVRGNLTIQRLLFIGDAFCAGFWIVLILCYCVLWGDPLRHLQQRLPRVFFLYQLMALVLYVGYVFLRVIVLASKMTIGALFELLAVITIGQHFYVRVWQPAIVDRSFQGTLFCYFCYAWLFSVFAYNRVQEFAPLKQLRGPSLPPSMWFNILKTRFTSSGIPDGDVESSRTHNYETDDDHYE